MKNEDFLKKHRFSSSEIPQTLLMQAPKPEKTEDAFFVHNFESYKTSPYKTSSSNVPTTILKNMQQELRATKKEIQNLKKKIESLEKKIEKFASEEDVEVIELRDISYDDAKKEIRQYFKGHHGEEFDQEDIVDALKIDFDTVIDACIELEAEGKIKGA